MSTLEIRYRSSSCNTRFSVRRHSVDVRLGFDASEEHAPNNRPGCTWWLHMRNGRLPDQRGPQVPKLVVDVGWRCDRLPNLVPQDVAELPTQAMHCNLSLLFLKKLTTAAGEQHRCARPVAQLARQNKPDVPVRVL